MVLIPVGIFFIAHLLCTGAQTLNDLKTLRTYLFTTLGYERKARPIVDQAKTLNVSMTLHFSGIDSLDDVNEKLKTIGYLEIQWIDEQLVWTPDDYGNISGIYLLQKEIWKPDIVLQNGVSEFSELGGKFYYVYVTSDGVVTWYPYSVFETRCSVDLTYFPFDRQTCQIKFVVWSHSVAEILLVGGSLVMSDFEKNSVWTMVSYTSDFTIDTLDSLIIFTFVLDRKPLYFLTNTILPVILLGLLNTFVFIIPADSGEKMGFSVTLFLAFSVFLTIIASEIPKNSEYVSVLSVYMIGQLIQSVIIVLLSSVQLRYRHRSPDVCLSKFYKSLIKMSTYLQCCYDPAKCKRDTKVVNMKEVNDDGAHSEKEKVIDRASAAISTWRDVSSAIDYLGFCVFLMTAVLWNIVCLVTAASAGG